MSNVLIIGAGGVGEVCVHTCNRFPDVFTSVTLASKTLSKCQAIASRSTRPIRVEQLDANRFEDVIALIENCQADVVINVALPVQNVPIMEACIRTGVHYVDTSAPDIDDQTYELLGCYRWQWRYKEAFEKAGCTGVLSIGFDPGAVNAYAKLALESGQLDRIDTIDIVDCNGGNHGRAFATNFNPVVNIQEVVAPAYHYQNKQWIEAPAQAIHRTFDFPNIGVRDMYTMYHEEVESLSFVIPDVKTIRFWMTFGESYLKHIEVIRNLGLDSNVPIDVQGHQLVPLEILKALLPDPSSLGPNYTGKVCIGNVMTGVKEGQEKTIFTYMNCDHEMAYNTTHTQAVPYTTGVPAVVAAKLLLDGTWSQQSGVFHVEELPAQPFVDLIGQHGLPTTTIELDAHPVSDELPPEATVVDYPVPGPFDPQP